nr:immunoglobulin light chain junction region [Macaca mulatta]
CLLDFNGGARVF